jgi:hypothetical protein
MNGTEELTEYQKFIDAEREKLRQTYLKLVHVALDKIVTLVEEGKMTKVQGLQAIEKLRRKFSGSAS